MLVLLLINIIVAVALIAFFISKKVQKNNQLAYTHIYKIAMKKDQRA